MLLVISFLVFMLLGLPLFGVIGLASIISMIGMPFPMEFIPQNLYTCLLYTSASGKGCPSGRSTKATRRNRRGTKLRAVCTAGIARGAGRAWTIAPAMCLS